MLGYLKWAPVVGFFSNGVATCLLSDFNSPEAALIKTLAEVLRGRGGEFWWFLYICGGPMSGEASSNGQIVRDERESSNPIKSKRDGTKLNEE